MKGLLHLFTILFVTFSFSCKKDLLEPNNPSSSLPEGLGQEVPFINVDTKGKTIIDDPKIDGTMSIKYLNEIVLTTNIGIELRGSTSQTEFDKKSYSIEFRDMANMDTSLVLLDMPLEEDWVLIGPYSDKTMLRNLIPYQLSNEMGNYAPRTKIVELAINSVYRGIYILTEKIKRDKNRVNISKLEPQNNESESITGGYILKIDKATGDGSTDYEYKASFSFRSKYSSNGNPLLYDPYNYKRSDETYFLYEYPKSENITVPQKTYIQSYIQSFEEALLTEDFSSESRAYFDYIDINSFVDNFILNELCGNPDAYRLSSYLYKDRGKKLNFGPIWDLNLAFGNDGRSQSTRWIYKFNNVYPTDLWLVHFWWEKILSDPKVKTLIKSRWQSLRASTLSTAHIKDVIDQYVRFMEESKSIDRNYSRWDVLNVLLPFNSQVSGSYIGEIAYMKSWIESRMNWMDGQIGSW